MGYPAASPPAFEKRETWGSLICSDAGKDGPAPCATRLPSRGTISGMDLSRLRLIVSFAALALAVPLSVLGNILTPNVRDWLHRSAKA